MIPILSNIYTTTCINLQLPKLFVPFALWTTPQGDKYQNSPLLWLGVHSFERIQIRINDLRSLAGSWCIQGTNNSTLNKDLSVPSMHYDPSDLTLLILIRIFSKVCINSQPVIPILMKINNHSITPIKINQNHRCWKSIKIKVAMLSKIIDFH